MLHSSHAAFATFAIASSLTQRLQLQLCFQFQLPNELSALQSSRKRHKPINAIRLYSVKPEAYRESIHYTTLQSRIQLFASLTVSYYNYQCVRQA
ncbi:hypothetical protein [Scytonema sp. NUACC26]|uniref:hypothetical protein n=1 Tax=Scytonema sp. NUACC26 TaxID=3140176 RepID=UPI0038B2C977